MLHRKKSSAPAEQEPAVQIGAPPRRPTLLLFLRSHWKALAAGGCLLAAAAALAVPWVLPRPAEKAAGLTEVLPVRREITRTLTSSGVLSAANSYSVTALTPGVVLSAAFEVGDSVEKGQVLYQIDSDAAVAGVETARLALEQAQHSYDEAAAAAEVRAPAGGTLVSYAVRAGDAVQPGQELALLRDDSVLLLTLDFPADAAAAFLPGQPAVLTLSGTFEQLNGAVESVSGAAQPSAAGGILARTVTLAVQNPGRLTPSDAATAAVDGVDCLAPALFAYRREQKITAPAAGVVERLSLAPGSKAEAGTPLLQLSDPALTRQREAAEGSLRSAQLSLDSAQKQLDACTITAPISGVIVAKNAKAGETVQTGGGAAPLCIIYDLRWLELSLSVDELDILSLSAGQTVALTADAVPGQSFSGVVTSVLLTGSASGGTTTYPVTVRVDQPGPLMPGMNASAKIEVGRAENALAIPAAALVRGGYLLVTDTSPSAARPAPGMQAPAGYVYVAVEPGLSDNDFLEIKSGIQETDTVAYTAPASASYGEAFFSGDEFGGLL